MIRSLTVLFLVFFLISCEVPSSNETLKDVKTENRPNIEGVFGLKLGEEIDFEAWGSKIKQWEGIDNYAYEIQPPKPNDLFTDYDIFVDPNTNKIAEITANTAANNLYDNIPQSSSLRKLTKYEVEEKIDFVMSVLEKKYGKPDGKDIQGTYEDVLGKRFSMYYIIGDRHIAFNSSIGGSISVLDIRITVQDHSLYRAYRKQSRMDAAKARKAEEAEKQKRINENLDSF